MPSERPSLDDLRTQFSAMSVEAGGPERFGKRALKALAHMIGEPNQTAVSNISELSERTGVNASTLTRLARRLGYGGFNDLHDVFRRHVAPDEHFYSGRVKQLLKSKGTGGREGSLPAQIAEEEIANIGRLIAGLSEAEVWQAAALLTHAARVRTHAMRQFYSMAAFLSYSLGMLRSDVAVLGGDGHGVAHGLAQMDRKDVLVTIGCAPYTRATIDACRTAAEHRIPIVAITDTHASPLAVRATHTILAPIEGRFFGNNMASYVVAIELLLSVTAKTMGGRARRELAAREALITEMSVAL